MAVFTKPAAEVFAPTEADGTLRAANMGEAQIWGTEIEYLANLAYTSSLVYSTRAALYANLVPGANTPALVIGDPTAGYDGLYMKVGATTTGSWTRLGDVPGYSFIKATDVGAGTPNAIIATSTAIPAADGGALIALNIFETNTASPVTVAFNGGSALTIKTNSGNDVTVGGLTAGMIVAGYVSGSTFRLLSDQASAAILAAAEAAQAAAEAAQAATEALLASVPLETTENTWTETQTFSTASSSTTGIKLESTSADAIGGPQLDFVRNSASPAANDVGGVIRFRGMNSAASEFSYGNINSTILDPTAGSEDARLILQVPVAGAQTSALSVANGVIVGAPTGSYQGTGTINATGYYLNGVALPTLNADGGFTLDLATTPTVNMGIVFGGTWKAANKQVVTSTGLLTGTYATQVLRWEGEGHNASGATESGLPLFLEGKKTNYLTSTTEGQILGTYTTIYGGRKGDHAAHLFGARKVFAGTYEGSVLGIEGSVQKLDASGATTQHVQCYMGWGMYNPGAGLNFAPDGMLGFAVEPRVGETYAAFAAVERSDLSAAFEYVMAASTSRNNANIFYSVTGTGHASGAGVITAKGAPTFLSATAASISGGSTGVGIKMSTTANFGMFFGTGVPTLTAAKGSLYLRRDGTSTNNRAYINTDGGTTWTALTTAA